MEIRELRRMLEQRAAAPPTLTPGPLRYSRLAVLFDRLTERGCEFDFFQAVWLLERLPEAGVPVGERGSVSAESIRFRPAVSMGFPSTDVRHIHKLNPDDPDSPDYRLEVRFLGLFGVDTPRSEEHTLELQSH